MVLYDVNVEENVTEQIIELSPHYSVCNFFRKQNSHYKIPNLKVEKTMPNLVGF